MRNLPKGKAFNIVDTILLKENHTISKSVVNTDNLDIVLFSMGKNTDISREYYNNQSII